MNRKLTLALVIVGVLALVAAFPLTADSYTKVWTAQATPAETSLGAAGYRQACVYVRAASGSPDGTFYLYTVPKEGSPARVLVETYATPSAAKGFCGPPAAGLVFTFTGNTTGSIDVEVVLK